MQHTITNGARLLLRGDLGSASDGRLFMAVEQMSLHLPETHRYKWANGARYYRTTLRTSDLSIRGFLYEGPYLVYTARFTSVVEAEMILTERAAQITALDADKRERLKHYEVA